MKALVTGSGGQLGRALLAAAPDGVQVIGLARADLDIADETAVQTALQTHRPGLIINAAAYTAVDKAESDGPSAYRINRDGPALLARHAAAAGIRLAHVSTDFVFDGTKSSPYRVSDPTAALGVYGASKLAGEQAVRAALPRALIVRTAWLYAAHGANFMRTMLRLMASQPALRVVADQVGTPTHAASLASAIWRLVAAKAVGIHHYSDAGVASWYDFAVAIQEEAIECGLLDRAIPIVPIRTEDYPTPTQRPAYSVLDKSETYAALGGPARHWRHELKAALALLNDNGGL